ncbi:MOSC domain-containing protein [Thermosulfurimonas marina]|uniref:MOSC domain-containing protein n=1 Tax=Thermosulfurimonas marina TaxID=2047767 RepID=A0A6H1WT53_9BACT|nr:MOSC domain-containing protein [Thermosulfurimonas marina]QJA06397.1 MOSC domain-containing protein [Thermosulfurimonas marina]
MEGRIVALSVSREKGVPKENVPEVRIVEGYGVEGDAHGGPWHRQVSFLDTATLECMREMVGRELRPGELAENVTVDLDLSEVEVGDRILAGECLFEVTQIGKKCHTGCAIFQRVGRCEMRNRGIFTRVLKGGLLKVGDPVKILKGEKGASA